MLGGLLLGPIGLVLGGALAAGSLTRGAAPTESGAGESAAATQRPRRAPSVASRNAEGS